MYSYSRIILPAFFCITSIIGMQQETSLFPIEALPHELIPIILSQIDNICAATTFAATCTEYHATYTMDKILTEIIPVSKISLMQHTKALIHYAQQDDKHMIFRIMKEESNEQKKIRKKNLGFFECALIPHPKTTMIDCLWCTINTYTGNTLDSHSNKHFIATTRNDLHALAILLLNKIEKDNINTRNSYGDSLLIIAVRNRCVAIAKLLLEHNCLKNAQNIIGDAALHYTCKKDDIILSDILIQNKCKLNIQNNNKKTPLHYATRHADLKLAELLITNGADVTIKDLWHKTALDYLSHTKKQKLLVLHAQQTSKDVKQSTKRKTSHSNKDKRQSKRHKK